MLKSYKIRLYSTMRQRQLLEKHFGCARFVYNWALEQKIKAYQKDKTKLSTFALMHNMLKLKEQNKWFYEVSAQSLQQAIANVDTAFVNFFRKNTKFPKFKSKKTAKQNFGIPQALRYNKKIHKIWLPKIGWVKVRGDNREMVGVIKTCTVSKSSTGKYFASILVEDGKELPIKPVVSNVLGIDLGLKSFATFSDGTKVDNPKFLRERLNRLKKEQKRLSRKLKGGKNREKAKLHVAKVHEKIVNQRKDFLHKLSYKLTHENQVDTLVMEDLNVQGMLKNRRLARSISDVGWSEFVRQLSYKADWYGKNFVQIGRFEPSSRMCNRCGTINKGLKLSDRTWICPSCKAELDRDINAACNIRDMGIQKVYHLGRGTPEVTLVESTGNKTGSMKQELQQ